MEEEIPHIFFIHNLTLYFGTSSSVVCSSLKINKIIERVLWLSTKRENPLMNLISAI